MTKGFNVKKMPPKKFEEILRQRRGEGRVVQGPAGNDKGV